MPLDITLHLLRKIFKIPHRRTGPLVRISNVHYRSLSIPIDLSHHHDLRFTLFEVALVDTDGIEIDDSLLLGQGRASEGFLGVDWKSEGEAIDVDYAAWSGITPNVGDCFIFWLDWTLEGGDLDVAADDAVIWGGWG